MEQKSIFDIKKLQFYKNNTNFHKNGNLWRQIMVFVDFENPTPATSNPYTTFLKQTKTEISISSLLYWIF